VIVSTFCLLGGQQPLNFPQKRLRAQTTDSSLWTIYPVNISRKKTPADNAHPSPSKIFVNIAVTHFHVMSVFVRVGGLLFLFGWILFWLRVEARLLVGGCGSLGFHQASREVATSCGPWSTAAPHFSLCHSIFAIVLLHLSVVHGNGIDCLMKAVVREDSLLVLVAGFVLFVSLPRLEAAYHMLNHLDGSLALGSAFCRMFFLFVSHSSMGVPFKGFASRRLMFLCA